MRRPNGSGTNVNFGCVITDILRDLRFHNGDPFTRSKMNGKYIGKYKICSEGRYRIDIIFSYGVSVADGSCHLFCGDD